MPCSGVESHTYFFDGIDPMTIEDELEEASERVGSVKEVSLVTDNSSGRSCGWAMVRLANRTEEHEDILGCCSDCVFLHFACSGKAHLQQIVVQFPHGVVEHTTQD